MLSYLSIRHLAIIESLDIDFNTGFTALTGETGAGKSILIDALNLTLGSRSDLSLIRQDAEKCEVSAVFSITQNKAAKQWLEDRDLDSSECVIRRQLYANGNTKAMINEQPVGQKALHELGELLVNIHSQHAHYALTQHATQRQLLDNFGNHGNLLQSLHERYLAYQKLLKEYKLLQQVDSNPDKIQLLTFQLEELQEFTPLANEYEELNKTHLLLSDSEALKSDCNEALTLLSNSESAHSINASQLIDNALQSIRKYAERSPSLQRASSLLDDAQTYINEAVDDILHTQKNDDEGTIEQQLDEIDKRLSQWHNLARKHHIEASQLYDFFIQLQNDLNQLQDASTRLTQLGEKMQQAQENWQQIANKLSASRQQKAIDLQLTITSYLHQLQMEKARFEVMITPLRDLEQQADEPTLHGQDNINFMFSANADITPRELSKIASGGELSRVALAIAVANAECATIPTLIFDEVDVGIGGATTEIVGQLLQQLGQSQQILSITHQAQVAAWADSHLHIEKNVHNDKTQTQVSLLNTEQRIDELARMIGGVTITDTSRQHAKEMLRILD